MNLSHLTGRVGLPVSEVLTVTLGEERGLGAGALELIELLGACLDAFLVRDYFASKEFGGNPVSCWQLNTRLFTDLLVEKSVPSETRCPLRYRSEAI